MSSMSGHFCDMARDANEGRCQFGSASSLPFPARAQQAMPVVGFPGIT